MYYIFPGIHCNFIVRTLSDSTVSTYPDRDALIIGARREFYDDLGSSLLLRVVQRSEPADDLDGVLLGGLGPTLGLGVVPLLRHHWAVLLADYHYY